MSNKIRKDPPITENDEDELLKLRGQTKKLKLTQEIKTNTSDHDFIRVPILGDGNCLFRAILYSLTGWEELHFVLRELVCEYLKEKKEKFAAYFDGLEEGLMRHIQAMKEESTWGTIYELYAASEMLCFNYIVYYSDSLVEYCSVEHSNEFPTIYLDFENGNHFNSLILSEEENDFPLTYEGEDLLSNVESRKKDYEKTKFKTKDNLHKIKKQLEKTSSDSSSKIDFITEEKRKHQAIYPFAKDKSDAYNEAYKYLGKKIIPDRILLKKSNSSGDSLNNWKKRINRTYGIKSQRQSNLSSSRLYLKSANNKDPIIPFLDEIYNIIHSFHTNSFQLKEKHYGHNITLANIKKGGFYWARMSQDVQNFIDNCKKCNYNQIEEPLKAPAVIVPNGPLHRIQADLWQIPKDIFEAIGKTYSHIMTCVDHFSKYKWCHLIKNKEANVIKQVLEIVFSTFKAPQILHTDNGREFKNGIIQNFLAKHQVKPVYGAPRHPQSQGLVERSNYWLSTYIRKTFNTWSNQRNNNEFWDISLELVRFVNAENNRVHIVTKEIPNILVNTQDKELIETVKERINNRYSPKAEVHIKNAEKVLKRNSKVLIIKPVIPDRNHKRLNINKTKSNQNLKKLPAVVAEDFDPKKKLIMVKFITEVGNEFKKNHNYNIQVDYLSITDDQTWKNVSEVVNEKVSQKKESKIHIKLSK